MIGQRKVAKETPLRRGRFRFLPLLRISLIETAKGACGPPLDSPGSDGKTAQKLHRLHNDTWFGMFFSARSRSETLLGQVRRSDSCGHPAHRLSQRCPHAAPFSFLHRARRCLSFRASTEKKDRGGALRSLSLANRHEKTDCRGSVRTASRDVKHFTAAKELTQTRQLFCCRIFRLRRLT